MGIVEGVLARVWENLIGRLNGPLDFRFVLQPLVVTLIAIRAGLRDARRGAPVYFWAIFNGPRRRKDHLRDAWRDLARVAVVIVVVDYIYQLIVFRWVYPGEGLLVAVVVALVPYLVFRGLLNRVGQVWRGRTGGLV